MLQQNKCLVQAKEFSKITPVTGIVLTKIDGTARGGKRNGAIRQELDIPVKLIDLQRRLMILVNSPENFMCLLETKYKKEIQRISFLA